MRDVALFTTLAALAVRWVGETSDKEASCHTLAGSQEVKYRGM